MSDVIADSIAALIGSADVKAPGGGFNNLSDGDYEIAWVKMFSKETRSKKAMVIFRGCVTKVLRPVPGKVPTPVGTEVDCPFIFGHVDFDMQRAGEVRQVIMSALGIKSDEFAALAAKNGKSTDEMHAHLFRIALSTEPTNPLFGRIVRCTTRRRHAKSGVNPKHPDGYLNLEFSHAEDCTTRNDTQPRLARVAAIKDGSIVPPVPVATPAPAAPTAPDLGLPASLAPTTPWGALADLAAPAAPVAPAAQPAAPAVPAAPAAPAAPATPAPFDISDLKL